MRSFAPQVAFRHPGSTRRSSRPVILKETGNSKRPFTRPQQLVPLPALLRQGQHSRPVPSFPRDIFPEPVRPTSPLLKAGLPRGGSVSWTRCSVPTSRSQVFSESPLPFRVLPLPDRSTRSRSLSGGLPGQKRPIPLRSPAAATFYRRYSRINAPGSPRSVRLTV